MRNHTKQINVDLVDSFEFISNFQIYTEKFIQNNVTGFTEIYRNALKHSCKSSWHLVLYENLVLDTLGEVKKLVAYLKEVNGLTSLKVREECVLKKPNGYFRRKQGGIRANDVKNMYKTEDKKILNHRLSKLNKSLDDMLPKTYLIE